MSRLEESFKCGGINGSIQLYRDRMVINNKAIGISKTYQLPINRIRAVIVERKSVMPFMTVTILLAVLAVVIEYNALWFLFDLPPKVAEFFGSTALLALVLCVIPIVFRTLFVSVAITWDGDPTSFRVGFVPIRSGKRLAKIFRESSIWVEGQVDG